jgi:hypothetical protein
MDEGWVEQMRGFGVRANGPGVTGVSGHSAGWGNLKPLFTNGAALQLHLESQIPTPDGHGHAFISSFWMAVGNAREATGRDLGTGAVKDEPSTGSWIGAIGYMVLLDQIGTSLKPSTVPRVTDQAIICALKHWTSLDDDSIEALYALRNALAHDYSLFNQNKANDKRRRLFALDREA